MDPFGLFYQKDELGKIDVSAPAAGVAKLPAVQAGPKASLLQKQSAAARQPQAPSAAPSQPKAPQPGEMDKMWPQQRAHKWASLSEQPRPTQAVKQAELIADCDTISLQPQGSQLQFQTRYLKFEVSLCRPEMNPEPIAF